MKQILVSAVAELLKEMRHQRQLSQEKLANLANLDRTYISGIERGVRNITLESLESIIIALSVSNSEFFLALSSKLSISENKNEKTS
ncbi:helix-turn-helix domain-containing protein [Neisseria sicca]|jgi:similar to Q0HF96_SHESM transcriptional regulator|uniref:helix-turn-helix domain-containing protein n=1 Tax=Neisseria sicca TaxID=490 RepID=UPI0006651869|nr:helix-turn-helix transcriptional regulator [Neisseria sicca]